MRLRLSWLHGDITIRGTKAHGVILRIHKAAGPQGDFVAVDEVVPTAVYGLQEINTYIYKYAIQL
jgi:hypothetical protein